jgi:hypothetical protein
MMEDGMSVNGKPVPSVRTWRNRCPYAVAIDAQHLHGEQKTILFVNCAGCEAVPLATTCKYRASRWLTVVANPRST